MRPFLTLALFLILVGFAGSCHDKAKSSTSTMVVQSSGSCVDVNDGSSQAGLGIDQQKCSGTNNQSFKFTALPDGYYTIQPEHDNLCLDAGPGSIITGVQVVQNPCSGSNTQKWKVKPNRDGSFTIMTPNEAGCLDVFAGSTANGAIVTTYACHASSNESFTMSGFKPSSTQTPSVPPTPASAPGPASTGSPSVSAMVVESSGLCVDVHDGSSQLGLGIDQWTCSGTNNQSFTFTAISGGYYTIQAQHDGLCLDAGAGSVTTGIQVVQNTCLGSNAQKWKVNPNSDGSFSITTANGAGCLDVYGGRAANGAQVTTYACHGSSNESFMLPGYKKPGSAQTAPPTPAPLSSSSTTPVPKIFNVSLNARAGDVISIQGMNYDATAQVWLGGTNGSATTPLAVVNRVGAEWIAAQIPPSTTGAMILWVSNSSGVSNSVNLNGAVPLNLDTLELVPGGAFRVLGRNLVMPGYAPSVTVDGQAAAISLSVSTENMLVVTAPESIGPTSKSVIMVDNGNGTGAVQLDRTITVVSGSGDPLNLAVGWAAGFTFSGRIIPVNPPCNGSQDDSLNIQNAINAAAHGGGGVVQLPVGTCLLANTLTLQSHVVLRGAGKDVTILKYQSNYPIYAEGSDLVGLQNFTLVNAGPVIEGLIWKQNTRSFFQNLKIETGFSHQLYLTGNQNFLVTGSDFLQGGSLNGQNPYLFSYCSGFVFSNNTSLSVDGSPTFQSVHDALIVGNHFTRNTVNQYESVIIATHQFVMDFAYRIAILGNTFDVVNGPETNTKRNDGETLLTEGGGGNRTENMGTVASATGDTLSDPGNTINVNPFGTGLPENYGLAIVSGTGAGQTREVIGYAKNTMQVDHPWDVIPDTSSHYATFVWGLEKALIAGNTLIGNPRGIWLYQTAIREVDISGNTITNGGGIFIRTFESQAAKQFDPMYGVRVADNSVSNSDGIWMSYINVVFVNKDRGNFGTADTAVEIRNNSLTANSPNVKSKKEDYANREGFMNVLRSEAYRRGCLTSTPAILGTIFQSDQCLKCNTAFVIGTGTFGTVLVNNQPSFTSPNFISDLQILGSATPASISTVIPGNPRFPWPVRRSSRLPDSCGNQQRAVHVGVRTAAQGSKGRSNASPRGWRFGSAGPLRITPAGSLHPSKLGQCQIPNFDPRRVLPPQ